MQKILLIVIACLFFAPVAYPDGRFDGRHDGKIYQAYLDHEITKSQIKKNWRRLRVGVSEDQVIEILGEPHKTTRKGYLKWLHYRKHGKVKLYKNEVEKWKLPTKFAK